MFDLPPFLAQAGPNLNEKMKIFVRILGSTGTITVHKKLDHSKIVHSLNKVYENLI